MSHVVYDTSLVAYSNGPLAARKVNNLLDRRLSTIERFLRNKVVARYNKKLIEEYRDQVRTHRNDVIAAFFENLVDRGIFVSRSTLGRAEHARAITTRWPGHDQHVLAAAIGGVRVVIYSTEDAHARAANRVRSVFAVRVEVLN